VQSSGAGVQCACAPELFSGLQLLNSIRNEGRESIYLFSYLTYNVTHFFNIVSKEKEEGKTHLLSNSLEIFLLLCYTGVYNFYPDTESKMLWSNDRRSLAIHPKAEASLKIISIVTPSYNQGQFIEETIQTVLLQKGNFYLDYIIMDGGSEDNSVEIIRKYQCQLNENCETLEKDGIKWYVKKKTDFQWNNCLGISYRWQSEKDNGQVHALKKGFKKAKGDIFCWLNSDDFFLNQDVFQKVLDYFNNELGLKLLFGDGVFVSGKGEELGPHHVEKINLKELLYLDYHILQPSTFFHRDIYNESHLDERLTCAFDMDFFIGKFYDRTPYKKVNDCFAAFRFYADNKTASLSRSSNREQIKIAWKYSKNIYFISISFIYRLIKNLLNIKYGSKPRLLGKMFILFRRLSYFFITGKFGR